MKLRLILMIIITLILGYLLIGQNLKAQWFYVDDHEIPNFLKGNERLALSEIPTALHETEFYSFGMGARFRPVYSLFRVMETVLWGNNPFLWYLARFIMFVGSFILLWILLTKYIGFILGFLLLMYTMTFPYWIDIWARMGPGEIYCVPAFSVFLWSFLRLIEGKTQIHNWILLFISSSIAIGSKETFAFLLLFIIFLDWFLMKKRQLDRTGVIFSILTIGYISYILMGVGLYIYTTGNDFYLNSVGAQSRIMNVWTTLWMFSLRIWNKVYPKIFFPGAIAGFFFFSWISQQIRIANKTTKKEFFRAIDELLFTLGLTLLVVVSQIYFYNGTWPTRMRYDFPGLLFIPVGIIASYRFFRKTCTLTHKTILYSMLPYMTGLLLLGAIVKTGYQPLLIASDANAARTNEFTLRRETIQKDLQTLTDIPIVYESCSPTDFEFITSLNRFLYKTLNRRTLFLWTDYSRYTYTSNLDTNLAQSLLALSKNGNTVFRPLEELKTDNACYSINVSCPTMSCTYGISLVQPWCISKNNPLYTSPYRQQLPNSTCVL